MTNRDSQGELQEPIKTDSKNMMLEMKRQEKRVVEGNISVPANCNPTASDR